MRILLVEDEPRLNEALVQILRNHHYLVDGCMDGLEGLEYALRDVYDVIVLDWMLPHLNGIDIVKKLRLHDISTPIIFLTAKDTVTNRIDGLDAGADDYLIKPFSKDELLARIRALSRRTTTIKQNDIINVGLLSLDSNHMKAYYQNKTIHLTKTEAQLLELLMRNVNQVLSKEQILDRIWGFDNDVDINNVELYIYYLRKKIVFECCGIILKTVRGVGYTLREVNNG